MPSGVPRTELEREERHALIYGGDPPAERMGRPGSLNPVSTSIIRSHDKTTIYRQIANGVDTLVAPLLAVAVLLIVIVVYALLIYAGLTAFHAYREKKARKDLPMFSLSVYEPVPELISHPDSKYYLIVDGAVSDRKAQIKFGKNKGLTSIVDPVFREEYGDFTVEITGRDLANAAEKSRSLFGKIPLLRDTGDVTIYMYAEEVIPWYRNLTTPIEAVKIHIPSVAETVAESIPGWTSPLPVTPEDAAEGILEGKRYYIKFGIPLLSLLPGWSYAPGMWVPWGCIITETS